MSKQTTPTLVLLDAHAILHRAYHALPDFAAPTGEPTGSLYGVTTMLLRIIEDFKPQYIAACYDLPEATYRHEVYTNYKAGRQKTDTALVEQIERSRSIFKFFGIPIYERSGFEADDMLGTIAHLTKDNRDLSVIIASGDMDTLQCVDKKRVQVFTLKRGIKDTILYDEAAVKERFGFGPKLVIDYKGLRGDSSDNIPGIRGIGEKTATELLIKFGSIEKIYQKLYSKNGEEQFLAAGFKPRIINLLREGREDAEFSKMLATIRLDALDKFVLTDTEWREHADVIGLQNLFSEFGFRNMTGRLETLFDTTLTTQTAEASVTSEAQKQAAILLWLLDSERTNATLDDVLDYGRSFFGTETWEETFTALVERVREKGLWELYEEIELPLIPIVEEMKSLGVKLDIDYIKKLSTQLHEEIAELEKTIYNQADSEFNLNSPKQLGEILFDKLELKPKNAKKTAGGKRSTKESELEKLRTEHPIIPNILRYRELTKLTSTYVDTLPQYVKDDGRVHSTLLQTGTSTGRMASQDPNLQNIPVRSREGRKVRGAFVAAAGYKLVAIDYSQIELRIAAMLAEDQTLIEIFRTGQDVHTGVAMRVFGVAVDEVTDNMRRQAKVINFGILYGMGVNALRANLGEDTSRAEAQEFLNNYFNTFTRLAEYLEEVKNTAATTGYTTTMFGRQRHFSGINSTVPFIRAAAERMVINAPIQGTAADCMRVAMRDIATWIRDNKKTDSVRMLLQVHDELIFEIKTDLIKQVIPELTRLFESVLEGRKTHGVPLVAEVKTGDNWNDLEPFKD